LLRGGRGIEIKDGLDGNLLFVELGYSSPQILRFFKILPGFSTRFLRLVSRLFNN
jgi:hypothetical protein